MYSRRHQTPEMLAILKSIHQHLSQTQIQKEYVTKENVNNLIDFVKSSHPNISADYLENAVGTILMEESNQSEASFSNDDSCHSDSYTFSAGESSSMSDSMMCSMGETSLVINDAMVKSETPDTLVEN